MNHCWKDYRTHLEEIGKIHTPEWAATFHDGNKTCMSERDHEGEHDFVDDRSIVVTFKDHKVVTD